MGHLCRERFGWQWVQLAVRLTSSSRTSNPGTMINSIYYLHEPLAIPSVTIPVHKYLPPHDELIQPDSHIILLHRSDDYNQSIKDRRRFVEVFGKKQSILIAAGNLGSKGFS
ncbi:hypothetical protein E2562_038576 [Oryza meyeriana var. granulata]|uniref:Uncharacterized protein n=1 Tax=Oryza meyeriana var. granulata TaxID=110450 RepID=A0A6G1DSY1_9ORYZ|nr:hypothetical protein E2562_038576 [Oryza meyeriana var. granulata]KAF0915728.1 hypothetical protein E2562_038576 [Oryza meyeriana var. granulata]